MYSNSKVLTLMKINEVLQYSLLKETKYNIKQQEFYMKTSLLKTEKSGAITQDFQLLSLFSSN